MPRMAAPIIPIQPTINSHPPTGAMPSMGSNPVTPNQYNAPENSTMPIANAPPATTMGHCLFRAVFDASQATARSAKACAI